MIRRVAGALMLLAMAGCASTAGEGGKVSWVPKVPGLSGKSGEATMLSRIKPEPYEPSNLAVGEEKDLARHRGDGLGFVRSAALEQYLNELRGFLILASGKTGVPGRVVTLADPSFAAFSTPDGNVYVSMGALETIESADEVAALLAHELSHVLLKHHTSDLIGDAQKKGLALYEIAAAAKTQVASLRGKGNDDRRNLLYAQVATYGTDKLVLPAWSRGQEREADFLGLDLLVESKHSPPAMISMLEKLQAWEKANAESEESFQERMQQASQRDAKEALGLAYQNLVSGVSANHPKTAERIDTTAQYLDRHYGNRELPDPKTAPWKALMDRPDVAQSPRSCGITSRRSQPGGCSIRGKHRKPMRRPERPPPAGRPPMPTPTGSSLDRLPLSGGRPRPSMPCTEPSAPPNRWPWYTRNSSSPRTAWGMSRWRLTGPTAPRKPSAAPRNGRPTRSDYSGKRAGSPKPGRSP